MYANIISQKQIQFTQKVSRNFQSILYNNIFV